MNTCRWIVMAGCCVLLLGGCNGGDEQPAAPEAQGAAVEETTPAVGDVVGDVAGQAEAVVEEAAEEVQETAEEVAARAREALETFQREQMQQLEEYQAGFDTIAPAATALGDGQLAGLLESLDIKLADVRNKLREVLTADEGAIEAIKGEIGSLMEEIPQLLEQARARFDSLKPPIETPDIPPIGGGEPEK